MSVSHPSKCGSRWVTAMVLESSGLFLCVTLHIRISRHVANSCRNVYEFAFAIRKFEAVSFISSTAAQIVDVHSSQRS
jgi:hypothetical protein